MHEQQKKSLLKDMNTVRIGISAGLLQFLKRGAQSELDENSVTEKVIFV